MAPANDAVPLGAASGDAAIAGQIHPAALQPNVGALLHDVSRLIRRRFERRARQFGMAITRLQAAVILHIARNEGISQATVAAVLDIEPIALVRMLDRLHEEGFVDRRPHPTDRRVRTLWLTPRAWPLIRNILDINAAIREEACAGLTPVERDRLINVLDHIKGNLAVAEEAASDVTELSPSAG
jgi:MarR family transcriptional regulator for hemolysin